MTFSENQRIRSHYKDLFFEYGDSEKSAQYSSRVSQYERYKHLISIGDLNNQSILDFGCGTATLYEYIVENNITLSNYIGVDILEDFFPSAQKKVPFGKFVTPDQLLKFEVDYCIVSGVFNNKRIDNEVFWKESITNLFSICSKGLAFNMMSKYVDFEDDSLFYVYPEDVFSFIKKNLSQFVVIDNSYIVKPGCQTPFEFAVYVYK